MFNPSNIQQIEPGMSKPIFGREEERITSVIINTQEFIRLEGSISFPSSSQQTYNFILSSSDSEDSHHRIFYTMKTSVLLILFSFLSVTLALPVPESNGISN